MTRTYTAHFRIRHYELDARQLLPNRVLAHFFQDTAIRASADAGYGMDWYDTHQTVWVIREMILEHLRPVRYGDELAVTTWLSSMEHVRANREYLARDVATGQVVARASVYWAHVDRRTLFPVRIPAGIAVDFKPNGVRAVPHLEPRIYPAPAGDALPRERRATREVRHYETDSMLHVNNAIYLDWLEEPLAGLSPRLCVRRHDIEYVRGARPGDVLEIVTRLVGMGRSATAWAQEITCDGQVIARNHMTAVAVDENTAARLRILDEKTASPDFL